MVIGEIVPETSSKLLVSHEQLLKAKKVEDESKFFHSEDKGCVLERALIYSDSKKHGRRTSVRGQYCRTHQADCHSDGWQIGFTFGTPSKMLSNQPPFIRN